MLFPQLQAWFCQKPHPNRAAFGPQNSKRMGSTDEEGEENLGTGGGRGVPGRRRGQARGDPAAAASARWAEAGIGAPSGAAGGGRHRPFSGDQLSCSLETGKNRPRIGSGEASAAASRARKNRERTRGGCFWLAGAHL